MPDPKPAPKPLTKLQALHEYMQENVGPCIQAPEGKAFVCAWNHEPHRWCGGPNKKLVNA